MTFGIFLICIGLAKVICDDELFAKANNEFSDKLFAAKVKDISQFNFVLSAFSAFSPLALLTVASEGESHDELLATIGFPNDASVKASFETMNKELESESKVIINIANRLYVSKDVQLDQNISDLYPSTFATDIETVEFHKRINSALDINKWIQKQTNGRIKELISAKELSADTRAMLVSTIYFKGRWKTPFDKKLTELLNFYVDESEILKLNYMTVRGYYKYSENKRLDAKLLKMAYEGDKSTFVIVLPNEIEGLQHLISKLKEPSALSMAISEMKLHNVNVLLPKFKIESETDLRDILLELNVSCIFNPTKAKLYRLSKGAPPLYVSSAIQRTFIEINEDGTEAAAVSKYGIRYLNSAKRPLISFIADHPFVFYVMYGQNILFSGVYQSPNEIDS